MGKCTKNCTTSRINLDVTRTYSHVYQVVPLITIYLHDFIIKIVPKNKVFEVLNSLKHMRHHRMTDWLKVVDEYFSESNWIICNDVWMINIFVESSWVNLYCTQNFIWHFVSKITLLSFVELFMSFNMYKNRYMYCMYINFVSDILLTFIFRGRNFNLFYFIA